MNVEDQVCSLELAQKLLTLGVKQNGLFCWCGDKNIRIMLNEEYDYACNPHYKICHAFTSDELLDILPNYVQVEGKEPFDNFRIFITRFNSVDEERNVINNFIVNYECDSTACAGDEAWLRRKLTSNIYDPNLANALAKMLIYLLENGLIKND